MSVIVRQGVIDSQYQRIGRDENE